jgi:hypothetical protein
MPRKASRLRAQLSSIGIAIRSFEPEMLWGWIAAPNPSEESNSQFWVPPTVQPMSLAALSLIQCLIWSNSWIPRTRSTLMPSGRVCFLNFGETVPRSTGRRTAPPKLSRIPMSMTRARQSRNNMSMPAPGGDSGRELKSTQCMPPPAPPAAQTVGRNSRSVSARLSLMPSRIDFCNKRKTAVAFAVTVLPERKALSRSTCTAPRELSEGSFSLPL